MRAPHDDSSSVKKWRGEKGGGRIKPQFNRAHLSIYEAFREGYLFLTVNVVNG